MEAAFGRTIHQREIFDGALTYLEVAIGWIGYTLAPEHRTGARQPPHQGHTLGSRL